MEIIEVKVLFGQRLQWGIDNWFPYVENWIANYPSSFGWEGLSRPSQQTYSRFGQLVGAESRSNSKLFHCG